MTLQDIADPIQPHLDAFGHVFRDSLRSKIGLVELITKYIVRQKGKKVRPILVLLSAELCGGVNEKTYRGDYSLDASWADFWKTLRTPALLAAGATMRTLGGGSLPSTPCGKTKSPS